jgi:hypothetical protein
MRVVTYEDRPGEVTGLRLLLLSLRRHCPEVAVDVFVPRRDANFDQWAARFENVHLHVVERGERKGFNVKPGLLRRVLEQGASEAVWMDSDVLVVRDFRQWRCAAPSESLIIAEDRFGAPSPGRSSYARAWGFPVGREMPRLLNACVVRALPAHMPLLRAWDSLLGHEHYVAAQEIHWSKRPSHMFGDQEVLSALLESREFARVPLCFLRRGRDIVHCFEHQGYPAHQMIANVVTGNRPLLVHSQGAKPWRPDLASRGYLDTSTYTLLARQYVSELGEDASWREPRSTASRIARRIFRDDPWTTGIPVALATELRDQRLLKTLLKRLMRRWRRGP